MRRLAQLATGATAAFFAIAPWLDHDDGPGMWIALTIDGYVLLGLVLWARA